MDDGEDRAEESSRSGLNGEGDAGLTASRRFNRRGLLQCRHEMR
jgi:hypothetical protein